MSFYFLNESIRGLGASTVPSPDFPVKIQTSTWEHLEEPTRIAKIYSFKRASSLRHFVAEVLELTEAWDHEIKMTIDGKDVQIETYTHDLQDITDLDLQIARACDQIYEDSQYIGRH